MKPRIAITLGDPDGIGPEIVFKALKDPSIKKLAEWTILGTPHRKKKYGPKLSGKLAAQALEAAVNGIKMGLFDALVTAPISKERVKLAGFPFPGHTEYLAANFGIKNFAMMLVSPRLRVVLTTIHVPLKEVFGLITTKNILEKIELTHSSLKKQFGIKNPKIAVCGLNPHAGEMGILGNEEIKVIAPAIQKARKIKINVSGPHSADTVFHRAIKGEFDVLIAQYHDQGLIPIKTLDFDRGVNVTLGLPFVRTSPDHGCAFDIAGKNLANPQSMKEAMKLAVKMIR